MPQSTPQHDHVAPPRCLLDLIDVLGHKSCVAGQQSQKCIVYGSEIIPVDMQDFAKYNQIFFLYLLLSLSCFRNACFGCPNVHYFQNYRLGLLSSMHLLSNELKNKVSHSFWTNCLHRLFTLFLQSVILCFYLLFFVSFSLNYVHVFTISSL